jgi:heparosan-N-sulfate-glucuronate 5-epimerase
MESDMSLQNRINYYRRLFPAYLGRQKSQLSFWHEAPEVNNRCLWTELGEYYMPFTAKADYAGPYDNAGVPMLNYRGKLGLQYNPIAIAQYGLGNYNLFSRTRDMERRRKWLAVADWLVTHLEQNRAGFWVWNHHFDWEYRTRLKSPWYSGLAQGQGISLLVRAHRETGDIKYLDAAHRAFTTFLEDVDRGGVVYQDKEGHSWFEEYLVSPPTHILNGFIWASWGVYDYFLATGDPRAKDLFERAVRTLAANLHYYDVGFWSLYEQSGTWLKMLASPFYHRLHIVQLEVLYRLSGKEIFNRYAAQWDSYCGSRLNRTRALGYKFVFKLCYY